MLRPPLRSTLFPYTTLFRSVWSNYGGGGDAVRFIRVGTLDDPDRLPPDIHIYTASKQPWVVLPPGARVVPEYYQSSDRKSTRLNSSHLGISYAVFCLKKKKT